MQPTEHICRYAGRYSNAPVAADPGTLESTAFDDAVFDDTVFDDTVLAPVLSAALAAATVLLIDDPLSFPWNSIDGDVEQLLVIDLRRCTADDVVALRPVLRWVTPVDTILDPTMLSAAVSAEFGCRTQAPTASEHNRLFREKQLLRQDRSIRDRAVSEVGNHVVLRKVTIEDIVASEHGMDHYLAALSSETGGNLVGVWGVRAKPGAPLHHGWAVFEPDPGNAP